MWQVAFTNINLIFIKSSLIYNSSLCLRSDGANHRYCQVPYGYNLSGVNVPPFGCLETSSMTDTFELRFDFPVLSHFDTYETDIEGVSFPPDVCWLTHTHSDSGGHLASTTHRDRHSTPLPHLVEARQPEHPVGCSTVSGSVAVRRPLLRRYVYLHHK